MRINKNLISSIFLVLLSIGLWIAIPYQIVLRSTKDSVINAQSVPKLITICIFILSIMFLIQTLRKIKNKQSEEDIININIKEEFRVLIIFCALMGYALIMPIVGFIISSILICGFILFIMKVKKWQSYAVTFTFVFVIYLVFTQLLNIQLP